MSFSVASANTSKVSSGCCPHGLPRGACPICSGMGGGGGSVSKDSKPKANEMSYDQCYAVWMHMKAQKQVKIQNAAAFNAAFLGNVSQNLAGRIANIAQKVADFAQKLNSEHPILAKPITFVAQKLVVPMLNVAKNIANVVSKAAEFVKQKLADISDKLNAIFGELKNFSLKKLSEKFHNFRKKVGSFFAFIHPEKANEEENKLEEEKRIFDMKNLFKKLQKNLLNKKEEVKDGSD